jgi:hypothetical protein
MTEQYKKSTDFDTEWVVDITEEDCVKDSYSSKYKTFLLISGEKSNEICFSRKVISSICPGLLIGVVTRKGKHHLNKWIEINPDWMTKYIHKKYIWGHNRN